MAKKVYLVENLDCANCAAKVEAALGALPEVQEAVLTYATMQLRITAEDPDALLPKLQEVAQKVEPGVEFYPRDGAHSHSGEREHHHDCCCGHDHDHEHHHHHHADEVFTSWGMETIVPVTKDQLEDILKRLAETKEFGDVLRAKGMLPTENPGEWLYFDLVPEQYEIRDGKPDYTGKVCVIGASLKEEELNKVFGRG